MGFRKHILSISLLLIMLTAGFLCVYTLINHNSNTAPTAPTQSRIGPNNFQPGGRSQLSETPGPMPGGQLPDANSTQRVAPPNGSMRGGGTGAGIKYAPQLVTYSIIFFGLFLAAYYLFTHKKVRIHPGNEKMLMLTLLCAGLLLRIAAGTLIEGHPFDIRIFQSWATAAANNLFQVYANSRSSDYPPLYMYVLFLIGKLASVPAISPYFTLLLKLPSIVADIATAYLLYKLARKYSSLEISILVSAFYIFNPAIFINSTFWGQVDSFFTFIVIAAMFMLSENRIGLSAALFAAAVLMKPQGIIFLPVLFFELVRQKSLKSFLKAAACALITAIVLILPFSMNKGVLWIFKLFSNTVAEYPYASVNAFNFFSLIGKNYVKDTATPFLLSYHGWGMVFIVMITAFSWFIYIKGNNRAFASAAALLQIAGVFIFSTRMHERYLFPAAALAILAFIYLKDKRLLLLAAGFSSTIYVNTHYVLFKTSSGINSVALGPTVIFTSLLNLLLFVYLVKVLFDIAINRHCHEQ